MCSTHCTVVHELSNMTVAGLPLSLSLSLGLCMIAAHKGRWGQKKTPIQVLVTSRRRKGVPRGAKLIPQGRQPLLNRNVQAKEEHLNLILERMPKSTNQAYRVAVQNQKRTAVTV